MNKLIFVIIASVCILPKGSVAAPAARARMWCWSMRFQEGAGPFDLSTLELTTLNSGINGELAPLFGTYSHWAWFNLNYIDEPIPGILNVNTPAFTDANGDGFDDFFDVSQGVSGTTSGIYQFDFEHVTRSLSAQWSRAAGSSVGTCIITLPSYGDFTHTFELLEYTGTLAYTPGSNIVSATVMITNTANPSATFEGPCSFVKSIADPLNQLRLQPGVWTNADGVALPFDSNNYSREAGWPTNYAGYFDFDDDGDSGTFQPYSTWELSIDALADADHDGVPDFSDDPALVVIQKPQLALRAGTTNLLLTISGETGHMYQLQATAALSSTNWQAVQSISLTNNSQSLSVAFPTGPTFWRVMAQ